MGKKHHEKLKDNFTKNYLPQIKVLFQDWDIKVMSYVMLVVIMIAMIAATVAWFTHMTSVRAAGLGITTASNEFLKVEVKQGKDADEKPHFVEVKEGEEDSVLVDLDMPLFDNVETYTVSGNGVADASAEEPAGEATEDASQKVNKLAPGVYGSVTIRLTALRREVDHFKLTPEVLMTYIDDTSDVDRSLGSGASSADTSGSAGTDESGSTDSSGSSSGAGETNPAGAVPSKIKTELKNLVQGHVQFFTGRAKITNPASGKVSIKNAESSDLELSVADYVHCDKYVFYNISSDNPGAPKDTALSQENPFIDELEWNDTKNEGQPLEITLYWYWPYEYANLSSTIQSSVQLFGTGISAPLITEDRKRYFDEERLKEMESSSISWDETQLYDYGDTKLGTYVKSMKLHVEVTGYHEEGQAQEPTSP